MDDRHCWVPLTKGKVALVDVADLELLRLYSWHASATGNPRYVKWYATAHAPGTSNTEIRMHRLLMGAKPSEEVDHEDGDGLNNTRDNLRLCSHPQNLYNMGRRKDNRTGFKGVHLQDGKYIASIQIAGKKIRLGRFFDPAEAARAYDKAAHEHTGKFARLNFPQGGRD